ncbi:MAG: hypothetical protein LKE40_05690 [Spirochaetia bacterium]|nr:hypothetical protein [Spirochaetia bacterium]
MNRQYGRALDSKEKKIAELTGELQKWKDKYKQCTEFLKSHNLLDLFKEFIRPKTLREKLELSKQKASEQDQQKSELEIVKDKKHDIAI